MKFLPAVFTCTWFAYFCQWCFYCRNAIQLLLWVLWAWFQATHQPLLHDQPEHTLHLLVWLDSFWLRVTAQHHHDLHFHCSWATYLKVCLKPMTSLSQSVQCYRRITANKVALLIQLQLIIVNWCETLHFTETINITPNLIIINYLNHVLHCILFKKRKKEKSFIFNYLKQIYVW